LDAYVAQRTAVFAARRHGGAVASVSAEGDTLALLRFYGWLDRTGNVPAGAFLYLSLLRRADLGDLVQRYAEWLQSVQSLRFSSIANYLNGLAGILTWVYSELPVDAEVLQMDPSPLTQVLNLRGQAEKASKTQNMFEKRVGGSWLTWSQVQEARVSAMNAASSYDGADAQKKQSLLRDACAISLLSLLPPDRVGLIRKLRLGHTLKRIEGGGWRLDLRYKAARWAQDIEILRCIAREACARS
jgi:hypothetical protein